MIDWLSFSIPYSGPPVGVEFFKRDGWDPVRQTFGDLVPAFNKAVAVEGSHSSKMLVQVIGGRLYVSGNPVKWLTGQNVVGTNDIRKLIAHTLDVLIDLLRLYECPKMLGALTNGDVSLTRVDCTFSYRVGSDQDVALWLEAMEGASIARFRGRGHYSSAMCTLTYGMTFKEGQKSTGSVYSSFKFYNKWREMGAHPPKCSFLLGEQLRSKVWGTVRGEACYRGKELKKLKMDKLRTWTKETCFKLHNDWVKKLEIAEKFELKAMKENELPRRLQSTYRHWRNGEIVKELLSKPTYYNHRKALREYGIDIAATPLAASESKVIPVLRVIEAQPVPEEEDERLFWKLAA